MQYIILTLYSCIKIVASKSIVAAKSTVGGWMGERRGGGFEIHLLTLSQPTVAHVQLRILTFFSSCVNKSFLLLKRIRETKHVEVEYE